ncbi:hypothetical protein CC1G_07233 [Coprinopsis cinerea okayama7|uniref:CHAT domain-containing protein n=1 Tax=Coprinopsis cinerea (strain Okayama-7 / 130 / ATCC MYA-4618 / FGSC 9003) TaxID=240176 RepID=A8PD10_COPC7|nr:hypothetical protein CC1G_07233 [Coprinopsis cinerea okayama7\|eukprot:XP_001840503.2 hypothetical protein CC1G_07233 [Coprinopsis cinerea okayama7\
MSLLTNTYRPPPAVNPIDEALSLFHSVLPFAFQLRRYKDDPSSLFSLVAALHHLRFRGTRELDHLVQSISLHRQALELRPAPHPSRIYSLRNLAGVLDALFDETRDDSRLEEAVEVGREAVSSLPPPEIYDVEEVVFGTPLFAWVSSLSQLARALERLFHVIPESHPAFYSFQSFTMSQRERQALESTSPENAEGYQFALHALASTLQQSYHDPSNSLSNLDESISLHQRALIIPNREGTWSTLNNLGYALWLRYEKTRSKKDLEDSIAFSREALLTPTQGEPVIKWLTLNNLARALISRLEVEYDEGAHEEATQLVQKALALKPSPHTERFYPLRTMAYAYQARYNHLRDPNDLARALDAFQQACTYPTGVTLERFRTTLAWAAFALEKNRDQHHWALTAYRHAVSLLPRLIPFSKNMASRRNILLHSRGLGATAARVAIELGELEEAVTLLCAVQSMFWTLSLNLRTPIDDLAAVNPELAERLQWLSRSLEQGVLRGPNPNNATNTQGEYEQFTIAEEFDAVMREVRKMEGFEEFMKPLEFSRLRQAACNGPVVILIAHERGCDALALRASTGLIHIPLSKISYRKVVMLGDAIQSIVGGGSVCSRHYGMEEEEKLEGLYRDVRKILPGSSRITGLRGSQDQRFETVLGVLWTSIAHPILEALDLKNKTENPPRMWWLPTGPFIRLPIHAAGLYSGSQPTCLSDFATPSYCTNLSDLLRPRSEPVGESSAPRVLAVMQEEVPDHPHLKLPKIPAELESLQNSIWEARMESCSSTSSPSEANLSRLDLIAQVGTSESPTSPAAVLEELHQGVDIAHFGCHGVQNLENPLESHLMLSGGKLTMTDLFQVRADGSNGWSLPGGPVVPFSKKRIAESEPENPQTQGKRRRV